MNNHAFALWNSGLRYRSSRGSRRRGRRVSLPLPPRGTPLPQALVWNAADLEQVGAIGLIKAVDRYDAAQTAPFEAYAWLLVLGELMHHVRDGERILRAPRRVRDLERRWVDAERKLWVLLGREPREEDVASYVNATPAQRREVRDYRASGRVVSFELVSLAEQRQPCFRRRFGSNGAREVFSGAYSLGTTHRQGHPSRPYAMASPRTSPKRSATPCRSARSSSPTNPPEHS